MTTSWKALVERANTAIAETLTLNSEEIDALINFDTAVQQVMIGFENAIDTAIDRLEN